jgi:hypothetical protein
MKSPSLKGRGRACVYLPPGWSSDEVSKLTHYPAVSATPAHNIEGTFSAARQRAPLRSDFEDIALPLW